MDAPCAAAEHLRKERCGRSQDHSPRLMGTSLAPEEPAGVKVTGQQPWRGRGGGRRTLTPHAPRLLAGLGSGLVPRAVSRAVTCRHRQEQAPDL